MNGERLDSPDQIPEALRQRLLGVLPDKDGDGIPDVLQGRVDFGALGDATTVSQTVEINGQIYHDLNDVPAQFRQFLAAFAGPGVADAAAPSAAATAAAPAATPAASHAHSHQVMLNGQVVDAQAALGAVPEKKWWQFWK